MLKINVTVNTKAMPRKDPGPVLRQAFSKKNMPKLYRFIQVATGKALGDKSSLPRFYGRIAFYDDDRQLTGKKGRHLISQFNTLTEQGPENVNLVVSNKKDVGRWNLFWMLTDGTRSYNAAPKFMKFYDRYGDKSRTGPGFRQVQFRHGNERFVPLFHTWLEQRVQAGVDAGIQKWEMSGTAEEEFAKVLRKAGFNPEI